MPEQSASAGRTAGAASPPLPCPGMGTAMLSSCSLLAVQVPVFGYMKSPQKWFTE